MAKIVAPRSDSSHRFKGTCLISFFRRSKLEYADLILAYHGDYL